MVRRTYRGVLILLACSISFGCAGKDVRGDAQLATDANARAEVERLNALMATKRPVSKIDVDSLVRLREQYPGAATVTRLLQNAYIKRGDWLAAEQLVSAIPEPERTDADRLNLARIQLKQGKFTDAQHGLRSIGTTSAERVEAAALLGQTEFYSGNIPDAIKSFESVLPQLVEQKRVDDLALLGIAYHRQGNNTKAVEILRNAVGMGPNSIAALSALVRVYSAEGDNDNAEAMESKIEELSGQLGEEEKRKSRQVALFYQLEDAYAAKDHDRVIALVNQIRPEADPPTMAMLHQYLAAAYKAQGKEAEANSELEKAARLVQK